MSASSWMTCSRYRLFRRARHDDRRRDADREPVGDRVNGLESVQAGFVMVRTADGHGQHKLTKLRNPKLAEIEPASKPPNTLGLRSVMFTVESVDDTVVRLRANGAELVGRVADTRTSTDSAICLTDSLKLLYGHCLRRPNHQRSRFETQYIWASRVFLSE